MPILKVYTRLQSGKNELQYEGDSQSEEGKAWLERVEGYREISRRKGIPSRWSYEIVETEQKSEVSGGSS